MMNHWLPRVLVPAAASATQRARLEDAKPPGNSTMLVTRHGVSSRFDMDDHCTAALSGRLRYLSAAGTKRGGGLETVDEHHAFVVVGSGVAGRAAVKTILANEPGADLLVLDAGQAGGRGDLARGAFAGLVATRVDPQRRLVRCADGRTVGFGALLLACGASPATVPRGDPDFVDPGCPSSSVRELRGKEDREAVLAAVRRGERVVIVGGSIGDGGGGDAGGTRETERPQLFAAAA